MENKAITVLVKTHKRPKMLRRCINSLNTQTKNNFNVLIISDYKDDNVEKLVDEYKNLNFIFKHVEPLGYPLCCLYTNQVKDIVNSKYVIFIDDDDEITDNTYLESLENIFTKNENSAVIMSKSEFPGRIIPSNDRWNCLPGAGHVSTLNFCIRTDIYKKYDWNGSALADYEFISTIFGNIDWKKEVYWYDKITTKANYPGFGKTEY